MRFSLKSLALIVVLTLIGITGTNAMPVPDDVSPPLEPTSTTSSPPPPASTDISLKCLTALYNLRNSPVVDCVINVTYPFGQNSSAVLIEEEDLHHFCTSSNCTVDKFDDVSKIVNSQCAEDIRGGNPNITILVEALHEIPLTIEFGCLKNYTGGYCTIESQDKILKYYLDNKTLPPPTPGNVTGMVEELPFDVMCTACTYDTIEIFSKVNMTQYPLLEGFATSIAAKCGKPF
jgi:hypothetical protein